MVNEKLIIPKENIYKTEEVRYLDNNKSSRFTNFLELVLPKVHCVNDKDKEMSKSIIGGTFEVVDNVFPPASGVGKAMVKTGGEISKKIGDDTGNQDAKDASEIMTGSVKKSFEDTKERAEKNGEKM